MSQSRVRFTNAVDGASGPRELECSDDLSWIGSEVLCWTGRGCRRAFEVRGRSVSATLARAGRGRGGGYHAGLSGPAGRLRQPARPSRRVSPAGSRPGRWRSAATTKDEAVRPFWWPSTTAPSARRSPKKSRRGCEKKVGLKRERFVVCSTHTHCGPALNSGLDFHLRQSAAGRPESADRPLYPRADRRDRRRPHWRPWRSRLRRAWRGVRDVSASRPTAAS